MAKFLAVAKAKAKRAARHAIVQMFLSSPSGQVPKELAEKHATEIFEGMMAAMWFSFRAEQEIVRRLEAGCTVLGWMTDQNGAPIVQ